MRKAFTMVEIVFIIVILSILSVVAIWSMPRTELKQAAESMINNLKYTKSLAQLDDRFFATKDVSYFDKINGIADKNEAALKQIENYQCGMWQFQFHQSAGKQDATTTNTYSIFADSAGSGAKSFDGKPMDGDIIARDPMTKACMSGYNENNLKECEDNFSPEVRFGDTYGVELDTIVTAENACAYKKNSTFSIVFDGEGMPYCKVGQNQCTRTQNLPTRLTKSVTIKLKRKKETAYICITKGGIIDKGIPVDKNGNPVKDKDGRNRGIPVENDACKDI
ncbi:pilus assembly FimT family protein [Helicobacter sp. 23-1045]